MSAIEQLARLQWPGGVRQSNIGLAIEPGRSLRLTVRSGLAIDWPRHATTQVFVRSPGFNTPTECWSWLFGQGVAHHDGRVELGPDGCWRGSGEVTGG